MRISMHLVGLQDIRKASRDRRRRARQPVVDGLENRLVLTQAGSIAPTAEIIHASRVSVTLTTDQVTRVYGQTVSLFATLKRSDTGIRLPTETIKFSIDGDYVGSAKIDAYGNYAQLNLPASAVAKYHVGKHTITAKYDGSADFHSAQAQNNYIVYQSTPSITGQNVSGKNGATVKVTATVVDKYTSAPLAGKRIDVTIDNRSMGNYTTDSSGKISYSYKIPQKYAHLVKYTFNGDTDYRSTTGSAVITGT